MELAVNTPSTPTRGAPTLYRPEYCAAIVKFFEDARDAPEREAPATITSTVTAKSSSLKSEVRRICAELPTLESFANSIGFSTKCLIEWADRHADFGQAYARAKDLQKQILIDRALTRQYDPTAFMFVARNITDMKDIQAPVAGANVNIQIVMPTTADTTTGSPSVEIDVQRR